MTCYIDVYSSESLTSGAGRARTRGPAPQGASVAASGRATPSKLDEHILNELPATQFWPVARTEGRWLLSEAPGPVWDAADRQAGAEHESPLDAAQAVRHHVKRMPLTGRCRFSFMGAALSTARCRTRVYGE